MKKQRDVVLNVIGRKGKTNLEKLYFPKKNEGLHYNQRFKNKDKKQLETSKTISQRAVTKTLDFL